ncbi:MAG: glycosyltransferase [Ignavibacteria bacterium]|nr:glycosyltransferase [Ignavibacteria bacterium]
MDVSVIIVNYNVKDFLVQCLNSLQIALEGIDAEIIIIDNDSEDGSQEYIPRKFPDLRYHWLDRNIGFGAANNIGIQEAKGRYVLLLNPDTIIEKGTIRSMIAFMDREPTCGIAGCRVLNADGTFQLACRRGLPTPWASFCKLFGLQALFPYSPLFARYNMTYKSELETYDVDALIGAFMFCRKEALNQASGFDTDFFMYGEDVDLCHRVQKNGWTIRYFHEPTIIHFKGESSRRSSLNEISVFYDAMEIFARKHFGHSTLFLFILRIGIKLRSMYAMIEQHIWDVLFMLLDANSIVSALMLATTVRFGAPFAFPDYAYPTVFIAMIFITLISLLISGGYFEHTGRIRPVITGYFAAFFVLSSLTYFFKDFAFSRGVLLMSMAFALGCSIIARMLWHAYHTIKGKKADRRVLIIGKNEHETEILNALQTADKHNAIIIGRVKTHRDDTQHVHLPILGELSELETIVLHHDIDEILIIDNTIDAMHMLGLSMALQQHKVRIHAVSEYDDVIVSHIAQEISGISPDIPKVNLRIFRHRLIKRCGDLALALFFLSLGLPLVFLLSDHPISFIKTMIDVLIGRMSIVGVYTNDALFPDALPGMTGLAHIGNATMMSPSVIHDLDAHYIRYHSPGLDLEILLKHFVRNGLRGFKLRS